MNVSCNSAGELLRSFAKKHNLPIKQVDCGDPVIAGSRGELYEHGPTELGLMIISTGDNPSPRLWNIVLAKCKPAGMTLLQNGDAEGAFSFNPENKQQARLAINFAGVRPKKTISEAHKAKLLAGFKNYKESRSEALLQRGL